MSEITLMGFHCPYSLTGQASVSAQNVAQLTCPFLVFSGTPCMAGACMGDAWMERLVHGRGAWMDLCVPVGSKYQ